LQAKGDNQSCGVIAVQRMIKGLTGEHLPDTGYPLGAPALRESDIALVRETYPAHHATRRNFLRRVLTSYDEKIEIAWDVAHSRIIIAQQSGNETKTDTDSTDSTSTTMTVTNTVPIAEPPKPTPSLYWQASEAFYQQVVAWQQVFDSAKKKDPSSSSSLSQKTTKPSQDPLQACLDQLAQHRNSYQASDTHPGIEAIFIQELQRFYGSLLRQLKASPARYPAFKDTSTDTATIQASNTLADLLATQYAKALSQAEATITETHTHQKQQVRFSRAFQHYLTALWIASAAVVSGRVKRASTSITDKLGDFAVRFAQGFPPYAI
jgi:hypothetical protein